MVLLESISIPDVLTMVTLNGVTCLSCSPLLHALRSYRSIVLPLKERILEICGIIYRYRSSTQVEAKKDSNIAVDLLSRQAPSKAERSCTLSAVFLWLNPDVVINQSL